jgi:hypothetical protein
MDRNVEERSAWQPHRFSNERRRLALHRAGDQATLPSIASHAERTTVLDVICHEGWRDIESDKRD